MHLSERYTSLKRLQGAATAGILSLALVLGACDTSTAPGTDGRPVTLEGRVTTADGYGKSGSSVEGATVTAASVGANGQLAVHSEEASTNADGQFELGVTAVSDVLVVSATNATTESRALVDIGAVTGNRVRVMPLTVESTVEADTYVETQENGHSHVTSADVALHVNTNAAANVRSGAATTAHLASAIASSVAASYEYALRTGAYAEAEVGNARDRQRAAFAQFQQDLYATANASAERAAFDAFAEAMVDAWSDAGIELSAQAKARAAGVSAVVNLATSLQSATRFEVRKQAMYLAALAKSLAVEAEFQAAGASGATITALREARAQMLADIRAAASANALNNAWAGFRAEAETGLAASTDLTHSQVQSALSAVGTARSALDATLALAASAGAVADAYVTFETAANAALSSSLDGSTHANTAANVLLLLSL
jgi:hypothetical protein